MPVTYLSVSVAAAASMAALARATEYGFSALPLAAIMIGAATFVNVFKQFECPVSEFA